MRAYWRQVWGAGALIPMVLVLLIFATNCESVVRALPTSWPVVKWQMYRKKYGRKPVGHRRYIAHFADGRSERAKMAVPVTFLGGPYRIDAMVRQDAPRFFTTLIGVMRTHAMNNELVGLSLETRQWRYKDVPLSEHLEAAAQTLFRTDITTPSPIAPKEMLESLLENGDFSRFDADGRPTAWTQSRHRGLARSETGDNWMLLLPPSPDEKRAEQAVPIPETWSGGEVHISVSAFCKQAGSTVELLLVSPAGEVFSANRADLEPGAWRSVEMHAVLDPQNGDQQAVIRLLAGPSSSAVYFDDVVMWRTPNRTR